MVAGPRSLAGPHQVGRCHESSPVVQQRVYILHSSLGARPGAECSAAGTEEKRLLPCFSSERLGT